MTNRDASDVNRSAFSNDPAAVAGTHLLSHELWFYLLFAAVLLIAGEWFTYHKRITL